MKSTSLPKAATTATAAAAAATAAAAAAKKPPSPKANKKPSVKFPAATTTRAPSAPAEDDVYRLPPPIQAPTFQVPKWNSSSEPLGITLLTSGESFLDGVNRIAKRLGDKTDMSTTPVSKGCNSCWPGMRVAEDQVGIVLKNGSVVLRPPGAYRLTMINPWKKAGAVVAIGRDAGIEFDPLLLAGDKNESLKRLELGQSYRQIVLQAQQIAVMEDQTDTRMITKGTYVYSSDVEMRGVIDLNSLVPVIVERETEDTVAATNGGKGTRIDIHGRTVAKHQGHGTTVETTTRFIPAGYFGRVAGITIARPEKGFVVMHKDIHNRISITESICAVTGNDDVVRRSKNNTASSTREDLEIEFGDLNHYAKSTPMLELKSKDNLDALCRAQIQWKQVRPDLWITLRGAFTDPFDMLEEKTTNMMRDWLLSVPYLDALEEKAKGFTKVEHQWSTELNDTGRIYGVQVHGIEITTLRFPHIDSQDEQMALQLAETNLQVEMSRQNATKEIETSKLNQATHIRMQEDRDRSAEAEERQQVVQRRKNTAEADTTTKKAEMDTTVVKAEMALSLAEQNKEKEVALAKASADAGAERIRAEGKRDAARLAAEGEIAATTEKNKAQLDFLKEQAALLKDNPGLVELLKIQNDLLKAQAMAQAATKNPNVVLLTGQEGLEARRMNNGHAPLVPGAAIMNGHGRTEI